MGCRSPIGVEPLSIPIPAHIYEGDESRWIIWDETEEERMKREKEGLEYEKQRQMHEDNRPEPSVESLDMMVG